MALKHARVNASRGPQKQQAVILVPTPECQQLPQRPAGTLRRASASRLAAAD